MLINKLWPALTWAILILLLTGLPGTYFPEVKTFWKWLSPDKSVHIFIFGVQTFLLLIAFKGQYLTGNNRFAYSLLLSIVMVFALLTEVLQAYIFVGRNGNLYDFIANVVGIGIGLLAYILFVRKKKAKL